MLLRIFVLLILSMNLYSQNSEYKSSIRKVSTTVVGFRNIQIKKEKVSGEIKEIWLRADNDSINKPLPMIDTTIVGTGFWVRDNEMYYLVTAEHVINALNENTEVIVSDKNKKPKIQKFKDLFAFNEPLKFMKNKEADVVVFFVNPNAHILHDTNFNFSAMPIQNFIYDLDSLAEGTFRELNSTVIGFPLNYGISKRFSPISKTSKIASDLISDNRADKPEIKTDFILLEDPSVTGFSGGPVFILPQYVVTGDEPMFFKHYLLLGLVHGVKQDLTGGKFALITPARYIIETINMFPKYTGTNTIKHSTGIIWSEKEYLNGLLWNVKNNFDSNGKSQDKGTLMNGNGTLKIYDEDNKIVRVIEYKNGIDINGK
jgi:hypothetical protein